MGRDKVWEENGKWWALVSRENGARVYFYFIGGFETREEAEGAGKDFLLGWQPDELAVVELPRLLFNPPLPLENAERIVRAFIVRGGASTLE